MTELLKLTDISKRFPGNQALSDVSVTFNEKEIHGIVGKNGAGKSTLVNIIMGIINADQGEVQFKNKKIENHNSSIWISGVSPSNSLHSKVY